jgi:hypothetical protein
MKDPLDERHRLRPEAASQRLEAALPRRPVRFHSDGAGDNPTVHSDQIDAYLEEYWRPQCKRQHFSVVARGERSIVVIPE